MSGTAAVVDPVESVEARKLASEILSESGDMYSSVEVDLSASSQGQEFAKECRCVLDRASRIDEIQGMLLSEAQTASIRPFVETLVGAKFERENITNLLVQFLHRTAYPRALS